MKNNLKTKITRQPAVGDMFYFENDFVVCVRRQENTSDYNYCGKCSLETKKLETSTVCEALGCRNPSLYFEKITKSALPADAEEIPVGAEIITRFGFATCVEVEDANEMEKNCSQCIFSTDSFCSNNTVPDCLECERADSRTVHFKPLTLPVKEYKPEVATKNTEKEYNKRYFEIGKTYTAANGDTYLCVERDSKGKSGCSGCSFLCHDENCNNVHCTPAFRKDDKLVCFTKIATKPVSREKHMPKSQPINKSITVDFKYKIGSNVYALIGNYIRKVELVSCSICGNNFIDDDKITSEALTPWYDFSYKNIIHTYSQNNLFSSVEELLEKLRETIDKETD